MKREVRRSEIFGRFASSELSLSTRGALVLLALLQFVAPSWHVCEMGGMPCHDEHAAQTEIRKPKCSLCPSEPPAGALYSPTGQGFSAPVDDSFHGTCLARLLLGMPSSVVAPFHVAISFVQRTIFAPSAPVRPLVATLPQPPSRGPPLFCL